MISVLRSVLPSDIAALLRLDELRYIPGCFVAAEAASRHADRLFATELRTGSVAYLYLRFDHSDPPDKTMPWHILAAMVGIWDRHLRTAPDQALPPILPLVVGRSHPSAITSFHQIVSGVAKLRPLRRLVPSFEFARPELHTAPGGEN